MFDYWRNRLSHKIHSLQVIVLMPHSRCNCRCVMCDIWKANSDGIEISVEELSKYVIDFKKLGVKEIALSGGEALMHSNLWAFCSLLRQHGMRVTVLSTGLLLTRHADELTHHVDEVIVSLDGGPETHNKIRNVHRAYEKLQEGVNALKKANQLFPIKGRCVLQKLNFREFNQIVESAQAIHLDQISFLAADVSSQAFNRQEPWGNTKVSEIALSGDEIEEMKEIFNASFTIFLDEFKSRFIAESPKKLMGIAAYYGALLKLNEFPEQRCNAPWVSAVVEADGEVRPCFFHESYGNLQNQNFTSVINSSKAINFRRQLDVKKNTVCHKCVCSLYR
jgi:MoaA/NifB/PqqE/SkfB family radical SAM enzyme